jgi:molecular chaperone DnaK (HSP70)
MDIGIDLGTTYSVIAVKGQVSLTDGYLPPDYLPECDVSIIRTPEGDNTFPSVFWCDPDNPDDILIGTEAKQKAKEGESPIMFSKRSIGTTERLKIHDRTLTAKEVAAHILRYLKECAEKALGQPVRRAVITHPAYFDPNQVLETREAAVAAGFDMSRDEQMIMEPAAAALAYLHSNTRDPLRVMTYDLGGGTFDVTVLERSEGVISMKAFDGDHLLGGYNFDRALVQEVLRRLKAVGRDIPYDENDPEDRGRRARMLQIAESVKIELSEQRNDKATVDFRARGVLVDGDGREVQVNERVNREQYTALIKEHLDNTVRCCRNALAKAGLGVEELDVILLVGGSTYGPWVKNAVAEALGKEAAQYHPDLCVAAGAAIMAKELPVVDTFGELEVTLEVPPTSPLPSVHVAGRLRKSSGHNLDDAMRAGLKVTLHASDGAALGPHEVGPNGRFLISNVSLLEDEPTGFTLTVTDGYGSELLTKPFAVTYDPETDGGVDIMTTLPKSLYLKVAGGMMEIAKEGEALPAKCVATLVRLHDEPSLSIPVFMQEEEVGSVRVENIPPDAGEGSKVIVTVEITSKNVMRGTARVLTKSDAVAAECPVLIKFPPLKLPPIEQMRAQFQELESKRAQELELAEDAEQRTLLGGKGGKLSKTITNLLEEAEPDKQEVHRALRELERLVTPSPEDMDPPRKQFRDLLEECRDLLDSVGSDSDIRTLRGQLQKIEEEGMNAFALKNHRKWAAVNESLLQLYQRTIKMLGGGAGMELPPTEILKDYFLQQVETTRAALARRRENLQNRADFATRLSPRFENAERNIAQMEDAIARVKDELDTRQALGQLQKAVRNKARLDYYVQHIEDDTQRL